MTIGEERNLLSRSEIADLAGVKRPAVTNWERRHQGYPQSTRRGDMELFPLEPLLKWLAKRTIPANARAPHEAPGTTYADRVRAALRERELPLRTDSAQLPDSDKHQRNDLDHLARQLLNLGVRHRSDHSAGTYTEILLATIYAAGLGKDVPATLRDVLRPGIDMPGHRLIQEVLRIALPSGTDADARRRQAAALFQLIVQESDPTTGYGDFYTPPSVAQLMADMLVPEHGAYTVLDPFCRAGDILTVLPQAVSSDGAYPYESMRSIAKMNLALHEISGQITEGFSAPTARAFLAERTQVDLVLSNPPFAMRYQSDPDDGVQGSPWTFGPPPRSSADFGWLQYALAQLKPGGRAGMIMPDGAGFRSGREQGIRSRMVEAGVIECIVALPRQLFVRTSIPVALWVLRASTETPQQEVLFIDARDCGEQRTPTQRQLPPEAVEAITRIYRNWRYLRTAPGVGALEPGPAVRVAYPDEIRANDYDLTPARYLTRTDPAATAAGAAMKVRNMLTRLERLRSRQPEIDARVDHLLEGLQP